MKFGNFTATLDENNKLQIPNEVLQRLKLVPGDKVEISLKRVKSGKLSLLMASNPLYKLLDMSNLEASADSQ